MRRATISLNDDGRTRLLTKFLDGIKAFTSVWMLAYIRQLRIAETSFIIK